MEAFPREVLILWACFKHVSLGALEDQHKNQINALSFILQDIREFMIHYYVTGHVSTEQQQHAVKLFHSVLGLDFLKQNLETYLFDGITKDLDMYIDDMHVAIAYNMLVLTQTTSSKVYEVFTAWGFPLDASKFEEALV